MKALNRGPFWKLVFPLLASSLCLAVQPDRATTPIDSSHMVTLPGHVHHNVQPQYDQGPVESSFELSQVTLLTVPSPSQQKALSLLLAQQQDPSSSNYHKWLTPEQYADRFGLSPNDVRTISAWLKSQGLPVLSVARGRNWIAFRGTAAQIASAFRTEIHRYNVNGETHFANATQPSIPAALSGIVAGIRGLDDFRPKPRIRNVGSLRPNYYDSSLQAIFLAPGDIKILYDIAPLYSAGVDGTGQKLAVVGQTDIYLSDLNNFRSGFGLTPISGCTTNSSGVITACNTSSFRYVLTGIDPGVSKSGDLSESDLDLEWSAAVARGAQIIFVNSTDVFTSLYYAIDQDLAPVVSMSYGLCELSDGSFLSPDETELKKANSLGITVVNSTDDTGAAGCDNSTNSTTTPQNLAVKGLAASYPASSPEVTGVGGTSIPLNEFTSTYWGTTNSTDGGTALMYVPEIPWNDDVEIAQYCTDPAHSGLSSCSGITDAQTAQSTVGIASSGGGPSNCATQSGSICVSGFPQPAWQTVTISGQAGARFTPDVSLLASGFPGYIFCTQLSELKDTGTGSSCGSGGPAGIVSALALSNPSVAGGTSASAQVFAGIVVLLNQYLNGSSAAGLGNINPTLYKLAATPLNGAFHQVTNGNNIVYCQPGTPSGQPVSLQCPAGTTPQSFGFDGSNSHDATTGYNLVTGLGSVDADKLAVAWAATILTPGVKVQASPVTVTRGTPQDATITLSSTNGFSGTVTVACTTPASMNEATCTPATQDVNVPAAGQVNATVTITATAPHTLAGLLHRSRWASLGLLLVGALLLGNSGRKRQAGLLLLLTVGLLSATLLGCGGGGASGLVQDPGTTPGTYAVAISVTSGGTTVGSGTLMVTVQ